MNSKRRLVRCPDFEPTNTSLKTKDMHLYKAQYKIEESNSKRKR